MGLNHIKSRKMSKKSTVCDFYFARPTSYILHLTSYILSRAYPCAIFNSNSILFTFYPERLSIELERVASAERGYRYIKGQIPQLRGQTIAHVIKKQYLCIGFRKHPVPSAQTP